MLEERLSSYDEISKQMLTKLEQAVDKISESNRNISQILIRHDERIDRAAENNTAIFQLLNKTEQDLREKIDKNIEDVKEQVNNNSEEINELKKSKWIWVGIITTLSFVFGQLRILDYVHLPAKEHDGNGRAEYVRPL